MTKKQSKFIKFTHKFSKVERHARKNILKRVKTYRQFNRLLNILGPGIVTGAADDDCSGIIMYSQEGAKYGFQLNWLALFTFPLIGVYTFLLAGGAGAENGPAKNDPPPLLFLDHLQVQCLATIKREGA